MDLVSNIFECSFLFGEDFSKFDEHIFPMGWFNHQAIFVDQNGPRNFLSPRP